MTPEQFHAIETPRTDAEMKIVHNSGLVMASFAAKLEREVALLERALLEVHRHYHLETTAETLRTLAEIRKGTG